MLLVTSMTSECSTTGLYSCVIVVNTHEGRLQNWSATIGPAVFVLR